MSELQTNPTGTPVQSTASAPKAPQPKESFINGKTVIEPHQAFDDSMRSMKDNLENQERIFFNIPMYAGQKGDQWETVTINGYKVIVKKGIHLKLPMQIADMLAVHYGVNMNPQSVADPEVLISGPESQGKQMLDS